MKDSFKLALVLLIGISVLLQFNGCSQAPQERESRQWVAGDGLFQTYDLERAQAEIPFDIVLPEYIPVRENYVPLRRIEGQLREVQAEGEAYVEIIYLLEPGQEETGIIIITEMETPISSANPEEIIYINGKRIELNSGNYSLGPGFYYFFEGNDIFFKVELYKVSDEEAFKVMESLVRQLD